MHTADGPGEYTPEEWLAGYAERDRRAQLVRQQEFLAQQQLAAYHRMAGADQGQPQPEAAAPEMPPPPLPPIVHPGNSLLSRQPVAAPPAHSASGAGPAAPAIQAIRDQFLLDHAVPGEVALVAHEGTQLAIACRLATESVNYVFQDRPWLSPGDVAATTLSWSSLQGEEVSPLPQVLWHHEALTVAFLATEDSLPQVVAWMRYVQKQVSPGENNLVVLCSTDRPLYDGAAFFKEKAPWAWIEMAKLSRLLSGVGGRFYYAWHMRTMAAHLSQQSPPKPLLKTRPLLAPGTELAGLFVPVWPPAEVWAVSLPTRQVDDLLKPVDLPYDQVQLLQGPSGRPDTQCALLPGVSEERRAELQQRFYTQPYAVFVPYAVYKGHVNEASTLVEARLKKKKRTAGTMSSLWRTVDFRCKALADSFSGPPDVQWDAPAKLRVALWTPSDAALFLLKIRPPCYVDEVCRWSGRCAVGSKEA